MTTDELGAARERSPATIDQDALAVLRGALDTVQERADDPLVVKRTGAANEKLCRLRGDVGGLTTRSTLDSTRYALEMAREVSEDPGVRYLLYEAIQYVIGLLEEVDDR